MGWRIGFGLGPIRYSTGLRPRRRRRSSYNSGRSHREPTKTELRDTAIERGVHLLRHSPESLGVSAAEAQRILATGQVGSYSEQLLRAHLRSEGNTKASLERYCSHLSSLADQARRRERSAQDAQQAARNEAARRAAQQAKLEQIVNKQEARSAARRAAHQAKRKQTAQKQQARVSAKRPSTGGVLVVLGLGLLACLAIFRISALFGVGSLAVLAISTFFGDRSSKAKPTQKASAFYSDTFMVLMILGASLAVTAWLSSINAIAGGLCAAVTVVLMLVFLVGAPAKGE